jgi:hypothetical protein
LQEGGSQAETANTRQTVDPRTQTKCCAHIPCVQVQVPSTKDGKVGRGRESARREGGDGGRRGGVGRTCITVPNDPCPMVCSRTKSEGDNRHLRGSRLSRSASLSVGSPEGRGASGPADPAVPAASLPPGPLLAGRGMGWGVAPTAVVTPAAPGPPPPAPLPVMGVDAGDLDGSGGGTTLGAPPLPAPALPDPFAPSPPSLDAPIPIFTHTEVLPMSRRND